MKFFATLLLSFVLFVSISNAQGVTTGAVGGRILDENNQPLRSATVTAIHVPSNTTYGAIARADGRFTIVGMRVGGPYSVTASYLGYDKKTFENVTVTLGNTTELNFQLQPTGVRSAEITVFGTADAVINSDRTGAATTITSQNMDVLPTTSRRILDYTRLTPQANGSFYPNKSTTGSFAGQDNRLNNITVDGSYFNNSFGLEGQPGERTKVAPISIDALEQIQVSIAPYDVRQGNFVGAGVNMVTKSGTNEFSGTVYYQTRSESFVGTEAKDSKVDPGKFSFNMFGATISGPVIENKLFFFVNFEKEDLTQPGTTFLANDGTQTPGGNITRVMKSDLDGLSAFLKDKFNYVTGPYQGYDFETPALRLILKLDYNLDDKNKISLRYNHLDSKSDILLSNSSSLGAGNRRTRIEALNFANSNYAIMENIRSIIGEWNSVLTNNMTNSLIVGYRFHDESREQPSTLFPFVDILKDNSTYTSFGTEPFTPSNALTYSTLQFQNNLSLFLKDHTLVFGVSVERYESENIFFPGSQSVYVYKSLDDFYTDANDFIANPNRTTSPVRLRNFQYRYSNIIGQDKPIQPLEVLYAGAYVQDEWNVLTNFKLTGGIRIDIPFFGNTAFRNEEVEGFTFKDEKMNDVKYSTDKLPDPKPLISPRLGFNFDVFNNKTTQLRGGTGIFTGQPAFVWISNQIGNNGIMTGFISNTDTDQNPLNYRPFNPNPDTYKPKEITGAPASSYELALTDPEFKFPQIWRTNLGIDHKLPYDVIGSLEFMYSADVNGVYYINANLPAPDQAYQGPDNRPRWTNNRINAKISNATVIKNQNEGYSWNIAASLEKMFSSGLYAKVGYSYGEAKNTVDPGSIAFGSWVNNRHSNNPNNPGLSWSTYSPDHRVFGAVSYRLDYFNFGATTLSFFFESYTGGRESYIYSGDYNNDGGNANDLIYIPKDKSEMFFEQYTTTVSGQSITFTKEQQEEAWEKFIQQDEYLNANRGKYAERNGVILPMISKFDLSISQEIYTHFMGKRHGFVVRLDIFNFNNLLNKDWGVAQVLVSDRPLIARPAANDGKPVHRLLNIGDKLIDKSFTNSASIFDVYRMQLTLRYMFN